MTMIDEPEAPEPQTTRMILAVDALPFTQVDTENADQLLRQWLIKEVVQPDTPMTKATVLFLEDLFQWAKNGSQEPRVKVVK